VKTDEELLAAATNQDGSRRFYPPNEHPATAQLRAQIEKLEAIPESEERNQALNYCRAELAKFERVEGNAERKYLRRHRGNDRD
jgi:hypothetical protein